MDVHNSEVQQRIMDAAKKIFLEKGYSGTRMSDIAKEVNIAPATIYNYYTGKKALFAALDIPEAKGLHPQFVKNRNAIIQEALILFGEKGFDGTSMELIAQKSGYSKGNLYQYFESKEDLFSAVMKETSFHFDMRNIEKKFAGADLETLIYKMGLAYIKMFNSPERIAFVRTIIRDSNKNPEVGNIYHKEGIGYVANFIADFLARKKSDLNPLNLQLAAKTYVGSLFSFVIQYKVVVGVDRNFSDEEIVNTSTKIFLNGILKREQSGENNK